MGGLRADLNAVSYQIFTGISCGTTQLCFPLFKSLGCGRISAFIFTIPQHDIELLGGLNKVKGNAYE